MTTRVFSCQECEKRKKSIHRLTRHMNTCISQIIQQVFFIYMQPKHNTPILEEDDNTLNNIGSYENKKSIPKKQNIEKNHIKLASKSSDTGSRARDGLSEYTPQDRLLVRESSASL